MIVKIVVLEEMLVLEEGVYESLVFFLVMMGRPVLLMDFQRILIVMNLVPNVVRTVMGV
jgi:hypothetical protein